MRRSLVIALTCVVAAPTLARAQFLESLQDLDIRVSPFVGYAVPYSAAYRQTVRVEGLVFTNDLETRVAGTSAYGVTGDMPIGGPWNVTLSFTRAEYPSSRTAFPGGGGLGLVSERNEGSTLNVTRAGVSMRIPEEDPRMLLHPTQGALSLGLAWLLEGFPIDPTNSELTDFMSHWAITLGAEAYSRLDTAGRIAAFFAIEDNLVFWNESEIERRTNIAFTEELGYPTLTNLDIDLTHVVFLRAGLAFTF